LEDEIYFPI